MRVCRVCVIGHDSLEIIAITIIPSRLCDGEAIESEVTLTEQGVEEIICHAREVRIVNIPSRGRDQFNSDLGFISRSMYVSLSAGIKKFDIVLIDVGDVFSLYLSSRTQTSI